MRADLISAADWRAWQALLDRDVTQPNGKVVKFGRMSPEQHEAMARAMKAGRIHGWMTDAERALADRVMSMLA